MKTLFITVLALAAAATSAGAQSSAKKSDTKRGSTREEKNASAPASSLAPAYDSSTVFLLLFAHPTKKNAEVACLYRGKNGKYIGSHPSLCPTHIVGYQVPDSLPPSPENYVPRSAP